MLVIRFINDKTGDEDIGNYDIDVFVNEDKIWTGRVEKHYRKVGWEGLMILLADKLLRAKLDKDG